MNRVATIALAPLSLIYGAVVAVRSALYRKGHYQTHKVSLPVISVGNLTTGGTGKTPLVEWITRRLAERGHRVCILTRGYGRTNPTQRVFVSDGAQILADIDRSGDEAFMMAQSLLGKAAVVCDADRVAGANCANAALGLDVVILDDGFQHARIARDLDIVCVDATNPWGTGWLLPSGTLREPIGGLSRAGCIVITRADAGVDPALTTKLSHATDALVLTSKMVIQRIRALDSAESQPLESQPVVAFCAIGNATAFFKQLRNQSFDLRHSESFRDHHQYSQADIDRVTQNALQAGARALVTTAKDAVKLGSLRFTLPCYVAEIEIEISEPDKLLALIEAAIEAKRSAQ